jgi:hypothetical protein
LGLSSIEPNDAGDELDGGQEIARGLFVACGDRTKLLDLGEEVLDQTAPAIKLSVIVAQRGPVGPRRDPGGGQRLEDTDMGLPDDCALSRKHLESEAFTNGRLSLGSEADGFLPGFLSESSFKTASKGKHHVKWTVFASCF